MDKLLEDYGEALKRIKKQRIKKDLILVSLKIEAPNSYHEDYEKDLYKAIQMLIIESNGISGFHNILIGFNGKPNVITYYNLVPNDTIDKFIDRLLNIKLLENANIICINILKYYKEIYEHVTLDTLEYYITRQDHYSVAYNEWYNIDEDDFSIITYIPDKDSAIEESQHKVAKYFSFIDAVLNEI